VCELDPCLDTECADGEACILGECSPDPCRHVDCPDLQRCELTYGVPQCVGDWVGAMTEPAPEPQVDFEFRSPPQVADLGVGSDQDQGVEAGGEETGQPDDTTGGDSMSSSNDKGGCDQRGPVRDLSLGLLLLIMGAVRVRRARFQSP
jgi:hypothetical protein